MLVQLLTVTTVTRKNRRDPPLLRFFDRLGFGVGAAIFLPILIGCCASFQPSVRMTSARRLLSRWPRWLSPIPNTSPNKYADETRNSGTHCLSASFEENLPSMFFRSLSSLQSRSAIKSCQASTSIRACCSIAAAPTDPREYQAPRH